MRKRHRGPVWVFLLLAGFTVVSCFDFPAYGADKKDIENLINQTRKRLSGMIKKEKTALSALVSTQKELDRVEGRLNQIDRELDRAHNRLQTINNQINQAQRRLAELEKARYVCRNRMNSRLTALYKYGLTNHLEVLAHAADFSDFVNRFELVGLFVRRDLAALDEIARKYKEIDEQKQYLDIRREDLQEEKERIARLKVEHVATKKKLEDTVDRKQEELAHIQSDRKALEKALDELEQTSREMEERIRAYQDRRSGPGLGTGRLIWPLAVQTRITSGFGWRYHPVLRKRKYHTGIDLAAAMGTPILASDNGVVIYSGWNGGYGKMISIDHGNKISTLYAHCSQLLVNVGDRVNQGQTIAMSGSTGLSTGPHLHFEVRQDGTPVNPLSYLP